MEILNFQQEAFRIINVPRHHYLSDEKDLLAFNISR